MTSQERYEIMFDEIVDLKNIIKRQQVEIEGLEKQLNVCAKRYYKEGVKDFAEKLKKRKFKHHNFGELVYGEDIDYIANEMVGGSDA